MTTTATKPLISTPAGTMRVHPDGGTFRVLAWHPTCDGWGVAITEWRTYRNQMRYEVLRTDAQGMSLRIATKVTEQDARDAANALWMQDR